MKNEVTFAELTIEARTEVIKEAAEETSWAIEKTEEKMARLVELLLQQRQAVGHGGWLPWIRETFGDTDASVWKVQRWLRNDRSNNARRIICDDMPEADIAPRSERKSGAVEVVEPGQPSVQPDDDPTPDPPTNRKASKANRKTKEADKPKTAAITPEIVEEPEADEPDPIDNWFSCRTLEAVCLKWIGETPDTTAQKSAAKHLRKLADKLDPPRKFVPPSVEEVAEYCAEKKFEIDAEAFVAQGEAYGWVDKNRRPYKDWRGVVRTWVAWDKKHGNSNGKANGKGQSHAERLKARVAEIFG